MTLMEEKTLADHDVNVRSMRQELQLLEEQLKKHGRNELQPSPTPSRQHDISKAKFSCPICGAEMEVTVDEWDEGGKR